MTTDNTALRQRFEEIMRNFHFPKDEQRTISFESATALMQQAYSLDRVAPVGETAEEIVTNKGEAWEYTNRLMVVPYVDCLAYMQAYASAQVQQKVVEMERWIPVSDEIEIPDGDWQFYLEQPIHGTHIHSGNQNGCYTTIAGKFAFDMPKIAYYKPLPPAPKH